MSRFFSIFACALALLPQAAFACPGCKDNLTEAHVNAYGWSIIFMMSMPFLILGSLSAYFYYEVRKARKMQALGGAPIRAGLETYSTRPVPTSPGLGSQN